MSATLQIDTFCDFFGKDQCKIITIPGRQHHVQLVYTAEPVTEYLEAALYTIMKIHAHEEKGDILVFLPVRQIDPCHLRAVLLIL